MHKFTASEDSFAGKWFCIFFHIFLSRIVSKALVNCKDVSFIIAAVSLIALTSD